MNRLLALAGIAALVAACAGIAQTSGDAEPLRPGAAEAADLGYHGPLHRARILYGN
jgi:hypothetical protein